MRGFALVVPLLFGFWAGCPAPRSIPGQSTSPLQTPGIRQATPKPVNVAEVRPRGLMAIKSSEEFQQKVLRADKPVMVHFFMGGCSSCVLLEPVLDVLAGDYSDDVVFAKYQLMSFFGVVTNKELEGKYAIGTYPTVVLFMNGQERKRWVRDYDIRSYREALDEALGIPTPQAITAPAASVPGRT